jgi:hypothetical protein
VLLVAVIFFVTVYLVLLNNHIRIKIYKSNPFLGCFFYLYLLPNKSDLFTGKFYLLANKKEGILHRMQYPFK